MTTFFSYFLRFLCFSVQTLQVQLHNLLYFIIHFQNFTLFTILFYAFLLFLFTIYNYNCTIPILQLHNSILQLETPLYNCMHKLSSVAR